MMLWLTCVFVAAVTSADCIEPAILTGRVTSPGPALTYTYPPAPAKGQVDAGASCSTPKVDVPTLCSLWKLSAREKGEKLIKAATDGRVQELQLLLLAGADVGARDSKQNTALHWAAWQGYAEAASHLLAAGADASAGNWVQNTPLHWGAWGGRPAVMRQLTRASANVNARNVDGDTPLHFAAEHGRLEEARVLLDAGAQRDVTNDKGKTPADRARQFNHQHWIDVLKLE